MGEVRRGSFNPFDSKEEISRYARDDAVGGYNASVFSVFWFEVCVFAFKNLGFVYNYKNL